MSCIGCGREKKIAAKGLCSACYMRLRANGTLERVNVQNKSKMCSVSGCTQPAFSKGACSFHYYKVARHPLKTTWALLRSRAEANGYPAEWDRFETFLSEVGGRPSPKHQLRRIHSDRPWSKDNSEWLAPLPGNQNHQSPKQRANYAKAFLLRKMYDLTVDEYKTMLSAQNGVCAICQHPERHVVKRTGERKMLSVDHCHEKSTIRGLLCADCNSMLGHAGDSVDILTRAIAYLKRHSAG